MNEVLPAIGGEDEEEVVIVGPERPLWLPVGSIRAVLAIAVVGAAIAGVFLLDEQAAGLLLALAGAVIAFYFQARKDEGV